MELPDRQQCRIFVVAPVKGDYKTAELLLHEKYYEHALNSSGATCLVGRIGSHYIVLAGNSEDILDIAAFTNDTVNDILKQFPSIKAGFLIGVDGIAPAAGIARTGDVVVGTPQGIEPGVVQFDGSQTAQLNRLSVTHQMARPPTAVLSVVEDLKSWLGRLECQEQFFKKSMTVYNAETEQQNLSWSNSVKILHGKVASCNHESPKDETLHRTGYNSKVLCFERAAAKLNFQLPILTVCGVTKKPTSSEDTPKQRAGTAAVTYALLVASKIDPSQLEKEHTFTDIFSYEPFGLERPGFRLMQLHQGTQPSIQCSLFQAYLDEEASIMPYEALSYVWGSQNTPCEITVDGKTLCITISLYDALCHLRQPHEDRILWVDALCIDQSNIKERSHQVNHMGEIYRKCENVIIWLGYLSGNAADLKTVVDRFSMKLPSEAFRKWPRGDQRWRDQWQQIKESLGITDNKRLLNGLKIFMENPWFTRVWVLQEVANAKRAIVECNLGKISAKLFALLPHIIDSPVSEQCQAVLDIMPSPLKTTTWWSQDRNLCTLLCKFKGSKASDPRDKVYALLGMASDMELSSIEPDYAKEEHVVVQELCVYIYGSQKPANTFSTTSIRELQSQLSTISARLLTDKLEQHVTTDCLLRFLSRQGMVKAIHNDVFHQLLDHGSFPTNAYLDKCEGPIPFNLDVAKRTLSAFPDVFDVFEQRHHISPGLTRNILSWMAQARHHGLRPFLERARGAVDPGSELVMNVMAYGPTDRISLLRSVFEAFREPMQLDENVFLLAIGEDKTTLKLILQNCQQPIVIPKKVLAKAASTDVETLQIILETPRNAVHLEEETFAAAASQSLATVRFLLDHCDRPVLISRQFLRDAIRIGTDILERVLKMSSESSTMIDGSLLALAAKQGPKTLRILLDHCHDPGHRVSEAIHSAVKYDSRTLKTLLELCPCKVELDEALFVCAVSKGPKALRLLFQHCILPVNLTDRMLDIAIASGIAILEEIFEDWASDIETSPAIIKKATMTGTQALEHLINNAESKLQITYDILEHSKVSGPSHQMLLGVRASERNITEDEAIRAIQSGPEGFLELLNRQGTNFRLNERICEIAIQHDYALYYLPRKRPSEWLIFRPKSGSYQLVNSEEDDSPMRAIRERRLFTTWEDSLLESRNVQELFPFEL
ncbi:uncharacterized protein FIESC28_09836 [Fusarium coffeatum]|uniref:Heterokaryon incompatibility domain-containing protein n=1 Tax=Fusarium coffeatum TaxID=231269 RepID=A0A366QZW1_9HYPO|nr:uncharacterized protein FIESC28_09836 [Fusarium coffeatum]RBR09505.1 hypothetical protein FIESC28_09836 [Fusarium coffeatum]